MLGKFDINTGNMNSLGIIYLPQKKKNPEETTKNFSNIYFGDQVMHARWEVIFFPLSLFSEFPNLFTMGMHYFFLQTV